MIRRTHSRTLAALALAFALSIGLVGGVALAAPHGNTGGGGLAGTGTTTPSPASTTRRGGVSTPPTVSVSADGITLKTAATGVDSLKLKFFGRAPSKSTVVIVEQTSTDPTWTTIATTKAGSRGKFSVSWKARGSGHIAFSAIDQSSGSSRFVPADAASTPPLTVDIVKAYLATFYGPGFWGDKTACGETLKKSMLGVASRVNVKCGTKVTFYYAGKEITVPVIDHEGSGATGAWDLTEKTAQDLGMTETVTVGASWR